MWEWAGSSREGNFVVGEVLWPLKSWNLQADIEVQVTSEKKQIWEYILKGKNVII